MWASAPMNPLCMWNRPLFGQSRISFFFFIYETDFWNMKSPESDSNGWAHMSGRKVLFDKRLDSVLLPRLSSCCSCTCLLRQSFQDHMLSASVGQTAYGNQDFSLFSIFLWCADFGKMRTNSALSRLWLDEKVVRRKGNVTLRRAGKRLIFGVYVCTKQDVSQPRPGFRF